MITIQVIHQRSGEPWSGRKVALGFDGFFSGGVTGWEYSSDRGEVHFDVKPRQGRVYVEGHEAWTGYLEGRIVVYV